VIERRWMVPASAAIVATAAVWLYLSSPPAFLDLDVYRKGVAAWWHGQDMYGRLPVTIAGLRLPFIYPPFAVLFLGPLAALPWPVSAVTMLAISLASLGLVIHLSLRGVWPHGTIVLLPLCLLLEPVWDTLWFGQVNLVLMALVALDCLSPRTRWRRGMLVGIAAAVKLTPGVFLLYFLLRKDYRAAGTAAATGLAATAVGFLVSWHGSWEFWFGSGGARDVSGSAYVSNQTVAGFLARSGWPARNVVWLIVVSAVLVIAVAAIRRAHLAGEPVTAMAATGCLGLIASPTSWGHHWVYVVPGVIAMAAHAVRFRDVRWGVAGAVTMIVFVAGAYRYLPVDQRWNWWQQVLGNSYVLVGVVLLAMLTTSFPVVCRRTKSTQACGPWSRLYRRLIVAGSSPRSAAAPTSRIPPSSPSMSSTNRSVTSSRPMDS
jgi:alpha-1,2-mannosyltransferase